MSALISELTVLIGGALATWLTQLFKGKKDPHQPLTLEEQNTRQRNLKILNAILSLISLVAVSLVTGDAIDGDALTEPLNLLVETGVTFIISQGAYHLFKTSKDALKRKQIADTV